MSTVSEQTELWGINARDHGAEATAQASSEWTRIRSKFVPAPSGCWIWTAYRNPSGYGKVSWGGRGPQLAHRVIYELLVAPIPEGLQIDHLCRTPACVNPDHLELVTSAENTRRGISPPAQHARKTHCVNGHPFDEVNTYIPPSGSKLRSCRACGREQARLRYRTLAALALTHKEETA